MSGLIGDRREKSALDEMEEVARERNRDVAEEERLEKIEAERKAREKEARKAMPADIPIKEEPEVFNGDERLMKMARDTADKFSSNGWCEVVQRNKCRVYKHQKEPGLGYYLLDNASMALLNLLIGRKTEYKETMGGIDGHFQRKRTLWRGKETYYPDYYRGGTYGETGGYSLAANALMAVLHFAEGSRYAEMPLRVLNRHTAETLLEIIEKKSKKQGSLLIQKGESGVNTTANLLIAMAFSGDKERAFKMLDETRQHAGRCIRNYAAKAMLSKVLGIDTAVYYHELMNGVMPAQWDAEYPVYTNALVACALAVIGGKELFPKNGGSL